MIDVNLLRSEPDIFRTGMKKKNADPSLVDKFIMLDEEWRSFKKSSDDLRAKQKGFGPNDRDESRKVKEDILALEEKITVLEEERSFILSQIPNLPFDDVPEGKDDNDNALLKEVGKPTEFSFTPKDYMDLSVGMIDTDRATRISGSRFGYIMGDLAMLEMSMIRMAMDTLIPYGFKLVLPPVMIRPEVLRSMGKGKFIDAGDAFYVSEDDLYMVASAEQSLAPMFMGETLAVSDLPIRLMGFSSCFRKEAGSYGKDTRGILRVHQFNKLEMFSFCLPEKSKEEHEFLLARQEELMGKLELPYRVVVNSSGDMGFDAAKQYDIEAWFPGQNKYRETHSCSNTTDFQSRGLGTIYKIRGEDGKEKNGFVHTLNATAFSERPLLSILENFQTEDGRIVVPKALRSYFGKDEIIVSR